MDREFEAALRAGDLPAVEGCLERGCKVDSLDRYGQTPLMLAVIGGSPEIAEALLSRSPDLDRTAKYNLTALMLAVIREETAIAAALIEAGADVSVVGAGAPGFSGKTALDLARERGNERLVQMLSFGQTSSSA